MSSFDDELTHLVDECTHALLELERAIFTSRYKLSKMHYELLSTQSIAMVYSIWEGFINKSFRMYIQKINECDIEFVDLVESIQIYHLENTYKQFFEYPSKVNGKSNFFNKLRQHFTTPKHQICILFNTEDNVGFKVLNRLLAEFGLKTFPAKWNEDYSYPNTDLEQSLTVFLRYRNGVAHGGDISSEEKVTQEVFSKYKKLVTDLMYGVMERMIDSIKDNSFMK